MKPSWSKGLFNPIEFAIRETLAEVPTAEELRKQANLLRHQVYNSFKTAPSYKVMGCRIQVGSLCLV